ncbi:MAG: glycosyltransferase family 4 protein [Bacteroidota bacterium]
MKILFKDKSAVVIVNGWTYSSTIMCIVTARLLGKKVWLRAESPLNQELRKRKLILLIKKILLKHFLFRFFINRCLYIGTENKKFFNYHGVSEEQMVYTPYAVDNAYFSAQHKLLKNDLPAVKAMLGIPEQKKIILFSGKYVSKKRPLDLVKAFHLVAKDNYALVMVGEGMLRTEIETYIQVHQLKQVYLTGFINQSDISKYYAIADVFVMCSGMGETWGLSVNEAMNFEKPIIVSATCGCSSDLVVHGINGFIFNEGDTEQLAGYLAQILEDNGLRESMGKMSGKIVGDFSIGVSVDNLCSELYGTD